MAPVILEFKKRNLLTGTDEKEIISSFEKHLNNEFEISENPYGDGKASERIVDYFEREFRENG